MRVLGTPASPGIMGWDGDQSRAVPDTGMSACPHPQPGQAHRTGGGRSDWGMKLTRQDSAEKEEQSEDGDGLPARFFPWAAGEGGHAEGWDLGRVSLLVGEFRKVYSAGEVSLKFGTSLKDTHHGLAPTVRCVPTGCFVCGSYSSLTSPLATRDISSSLYSEHSNNNCNFKCCPL